MADLLEIRDLKVSFATPAGPFEAVRGVSFRVPQGGTVALVGESGSGKSVVSQAIMGILPSAGRITGGEILFNEPGSPPSIDRAPIDRAPIDIAAFDRNGPELRAIRGGSISIIFQEPMTSLSPLHTVGDQVSEALLLHRQVSKSEALELTAEMLRLVGFKHPKRALSTYAFELSGGLRQRAMIAMALVCRPSLLIADEPTTALDVTIQAQILKLIKDLQAELGMALLLITHDLGVVANVAEEVVVMYRGRIVERGSADDLFRDPRHPYLKALLAAVPRFDMGPEDRLVPIREIPPISETKFLAPRQVERDRPNAPLLTIEGLAKSFTTRRGGEPVKAVDGIDLAINAGECLGLVGESGCGKTTLSKMLLRALQPDAGSVRLRDGDRDIDVLALEGRALTEFRRRVQYVFQDPFSALNPRMTVFDILAEPLLVHGIGDAAERRARVEELVRLVGLDRQQLKRYPHSFSGGQRQRIGIARALALNPDLLICDEPVSALDVSIQAQVLNLLKDLQQRLGLTYLFVSHNLAVVDYVADRIAVMCAGRIVELAPRRTLFRDPQHPYTKALLAAVPTPDLGHKLDFDALMGGQASNPAAWPQPFTRDETHRPRPIDLGGGHWVEALGALPVGALKTGALT
ncbi:ABC transporter ATP-binding protein [Aliidongia dinghuensis]|uniref:ABC transporter ATP-binding protein n=1 Tax=Aliidongia dinghuensis TaxID=1867774 RepID=A0A8J3E6S2_9PROT|nr:ABC transporter ATP-binding protein [Aliidongia dinghuensis]GGF32273.1 ABC transporter ATP-binding protein [Aliidongia dinghuensis]